jgi:hypothetical protein
VRWERFPRRRPAPAADNDIRATKDDFLYLDPAAFPADFAADVPPAQAKFMAHSQAMVAKAAAAAPISQWLVSLW